ncbi:hypothetical protein V6N13_055418 [Hibiscus sabdariffa]|uniref:Uncharacterized protein n=2 Tax=Hibiscus sabdariffa TaxID=183260 RepID=A0ABR2BLG4_9ROSI
MLFRHPSRDKYVLCNPGTEQFLLIPRPDKAGSRAVLGVEIQNWKPNSEMDFFKIISFPENKGRFQYAINDQALEALHIWQYIDNGSAGVWIGRHFVSHRELYKHPQIVDLSNLKLLALDTVSNDGVIFRASNGVFCYYSKSCKFVQLQCPNILNDAIELRSNSSFVFTRCLASLTLAR